MMTYDHFQDVFEEPEYDAIQQTAYARALHAMQRERRLHGHLGYTGRRQIPDVQLQDLADTGWTLFMSTLQGNWIQTQEEGGTIETDSEH